MASSQQDGKGTGGVVKDVFARKIVVPLSATLASAAAGYVVKRAPQFFEEKILPRLREAGRPRDLVEDVTQRAHDVTEKAKDVTERAKDAVSGVTGSNDGDGASNGGSSRPQARKPRPIKEIEKARQQRAEGRKSRRAGPRKESK
jgi:hypothetical protein